MRIGDLYDSTIISDANVDNFNVFFNFVKMVNAGNHIEILSPIGSLAYTEMIAKQVGLGNLPFDPVADGQFTGTDIAMQGRGHVRWHIPG